MTDRPIIFSAPMVRALLEGRKTQTRRKLRPCFGKKHPIKNLAEFDDTYSGRFNDPLSWGYPYAEDGAHMPLGMWPETWGYEADDLLWVRESVACGACAPSKPSHWAPSFWRREQGSPKNPAGLWYRADRLCPEKTITDRGKWVPSIFMPRWVSRLTVKVSAVKVERLQDISEADAIAEGVEEVEPWEGVRRFKVYGKGGEQLACPYGARISYSTLWDDINGPGAWDANPFVVAVTFSVIKANIDDVIAGRAAA